MQIQKNVPIFFIIIALIFAGLGAYYPWWSVTTSREVEVALKIAARADYGILQTVSASKTIENDTNSILLPIQNLTNNDATRSSINSTFTTVIALIGSGIGLTIFSTSLIVVSTLKKSSRKFALIGIFIAAVLLIIAPLYFAITSHDLFAKFDSIIPIDVPSTWAPLSPQSVNAFWGSIGVPKTSYFPVWLQDQSFWIWGAGLGWYLTFTAGLLLFGSTLLLRPSSSEK